MQIAFIGNAKILFSEKKKKKKKKKTIINLSSADLAKRVVTDI